MRIGTLCGLLLLVFSTSGLHAQTPWRFSLGVEAGSSLQRYSMPAGQQLPDVVRPYYKASPGYVFTLERQLGPRWSLRAGFGETAVGYGLHMVTPSPSPIKAYDSWGGATLGADPNQYFVGAGYTLWYLGTRQRLTLQAKCDVAYAYDNANTLTPLFALSHSVPNGATAHITFEELIIPNRHNVLIKPGLTMRFHYGRQRQHQWALGVVSAWGLQKILEQHSKSLLVIEEGVVTPYELTLWHRGSYVAGQIEYSFSFGK